MEIEPNINRGRTWRDSRWLIPVEFALVAAIYVGRQHHILKVSATPYLFLLAWISLRLRRIQWKQIGFTRYRTWVTTLLLGIACGVGLELFDLFGKQRLLSRLLGKPPDLSNFSQSGDHEWIERGIARSLGATDARGGIAQRTHQGIGLLS